MTVRGSFDDWPERYEDWFATPIGKLVLEVESRLVRSMVTPVRGARMLDAGCGTGIFTSDFMDAGALVTGVDISRPMLEAAEDKMYGPLFFPVQADMRELPFRDDTFDVTVSITALEFTADAQRAIDELFRVTRPGGTVFVATLNSLSPWAERRRAKKKDHILQDAFFRSPDELLALSPLKGVVKTAVHFLKDDGLQEAALTEQKGEAIGLNTGAFVAVRWEKPG
jgi:ubiquinone/menaquinone biosynthesis C-methylase UbiE